MKIPKIFEPEDFKHAWTVPSGAMEISADKAQSIFEEYLRKGKVVYYHLTDGGVIGGVETLVADYKKSQFDTHTALLINIQEIEKKECEHEVHMLGIDGPCKVDHFYCSCCKKEIKPNWSVVE